jgi:hypothetical protein
MNVPEMKFVNKLKYIIIARTQLFFNQKNRQGSCREKERPVFHCTVENRPLQK